MRIPLAAVLATVSIGTAACHKTVHIETEPPGARVRVDGIDRGPSPVSVSVEYNIFVNHTVTLEKEGYVTASAPLPSEGRLPLAICGYILCPPLLIWARAPIPNPVFVLTPVGAGDGAAFPAAPPGPGPEPTPTVDTTTGASQKE